MEAVEVQVKSWLTDEREAQEQQSHLVGCFHRGCLRPLENTVTYVMIHNSSKPTVMK